MRQSFKTKLKQMWFPADFRLPEPEFTREQLDLLEELIQLIQPTLSREEQALSDERGGMARFLVDLGTGIWRIRRKIEGLSRMPKEIKDALFSLESTWASMSEGGVEILDHTGTIPLKNEARIVEILAIPNLSRDQVVETIKPTIMLKGEVIQVGEVVMGRAVKPAQSAFSAESAPDSPPDAAEEVAGESYSDAGLESVPQPEPSDVLDGPGPEETQPLLDDGQDSPAGPPADEAPGEEGEPEETRYALEAIPALEPQPGESAPAADETQGVDGTVEETPEAAPTAELLPEMEIPAPAPDEITVEEDLPAVPAESEIPAPGEAEPEEKPKKKRAARKPKTEETADADEEPKPKRTRRKKKTDETTEVNDAG